MEKHKCLIVEDTFFNAEKIEKIVLGMGFEITGIAASSDEAIHLFEQDLPDIVLMDIEIEGKLDGIKLTECLRKLYPNHSFALVYVTGKGTDNALVRAGSAKHDGFVIKPIHSDQLRATVKLAMLQLIEEHPIQEVEEYKLTDQIFILVNGEHRRLKLAEMLYAESDGSYCDIYKTDGTKVKNSQPLSKLEKLTKGTQCIRVQRSYIVNITKVKTIRNTTLILENDQPISTSSKFLPNITRLFKILKK